MIILVDTMAERYGMLPSTVMASATTFDLFVCDTAIGYRNYLNDKASGRNTGIYKPESYQQDELISILRGES
jgi:hypothetical protein